MMRDFGAILWPEIKGSRYGQVVPAEGQLIANRAIFVGGMAALCSRAFLPGNVGSVAAWLAFPLVFIAVSVYGRTYYRYRGAKRPGRVLIVEDDPASAGLLDRLLRNAGWDRDIAGTLGTAKEMLGRHPDVLLIDIRLPDGSGLDLFRYLPPHPMRPRTIVMTASSEASINPEIYAVKPSLVVFKPITDPSMLMDSIGDPFE